MPDTSKLNSDQLAALTAELGSSSLLNALWSSYTGPIVMGSAGGGTFYNGTSIVIDPNSLQGPNALTPAQPATALAHELAHAVVPNANNPYVDSANPATAFATGDTNESEAYAAQYVVAKQLNDTTFFSQASAAGSLLKAFNALAGSTNFSSITSITALTSSQFFVSATATAGSVGSLISKLHISSNPLLTYQAFWEDQWVLSNLYGAVLYNPAKPVPYIVGYTLAGLRNSSIAIAGNPTSGWTFKGKKIPVLLNGVALPSGGTLTSSNATLTFSGSETSANTIDPGWYILSASFNGTTENLLYGTDGGVSYTLNARSGTNWFFVQNLTTTSTATVTINPYSSCWSFLGFGGLPGAGGILVDGTIIGGGAATAQLQSEGADKWSADGQTDDDQAIKALRPPSRTPLRYCPKDDVLRFLQGL